MTTHNHTLGFPRIGLKRELKKALEGYWAGQISQDELRDNGRELRRRHCKKRPGLNYYRSGISPGTIMFSAPACCSVMCHHAMPVPTGKLTSIPCSVLPAAVHLPVNRRLRRK